MGQILHLFKPTAFVRVGLNSFKRHLIWGETPLNKVWDIIKPIKKKDWDALYIIQNQTKCTPREGLFDISLFPLSKEFGMKMAQNVKSPWVCPTPYPRA